jgi:hypothetical protein
MSVRSPTHFRRRLARVSLVLAGLVLGWSALLIVTGGFAVTLLGVTLRSHNPARPALAGLLALAVFTCAAGPRRVWISIRSFARTLDAWLAARTLPNRFLAGVLAVAVCGWGLYRGSGVAGGADSYGYLSQAELWLRGLPIVPQPWTADVPWPGAAWTFSPLGYRPAPDGTALVPTYAVGLPLIMAATKLVAGHAAMFWLTPIAAAVLVLLAYVAGRRLDSPAVGITTAWLVATNATLISEVASPMSDVVAAAALAGSFYLLWDPRHVPVTAGFAAALAVAVRPNLASTLAIMALWMAVRRPSGAGSRRLRHVAHACVFLAAASPGLLLPAWANWRLFGSPFVSGYGDLASIYDWSNVLPNLAQYPRLLLRSRSWPLLVGLGVLLVPIARLWPRLADRSIPLGMALFVFSLVAQYLAYEFAAGAGYLRLLLPCLPFAMAATARLLVAVARPGWPALLVALAVVAHGVVSAHYTGRDDQLGERKYPGAGEIVRTHTSPASVIYAFQHSGSLRYYGGRLTLRYDLLEPAWLDRSVEWFAQRGTHVYAVLDDWEVPGFRQRFAGQQRVRQIDRPLVTYRGTVVVHLYDLVGAAPNEGPPKEWVDRFDGPRYPLPADPARVPWKR